MALRSTVSDGSSEGAPCTWQRKPNSAYLSAREMPDLASRRFASTSWVLLPMDETMPIPVTTTRLMLASSACPARNDRRVSICGACAARLSDPGSLRRAVLEQRNLEVARLVDQFTVRPKPAVRD